MIKHMSRYAVCIPVLAFTLAGCGGGSDTDDSSTSGNSANSEKQLKTQVPINPADPFSTLLPWPDGDGRIVTTDSGLQYLVIASGNQDRQPPEKSDLVVVHYDGRLAADGQQFDSSRVREQPAIFPAGALIKGWVEALQLMRPGDRWMVYIPYDLAYGEEGRPPVIPPAADLIFDVELLDVRDKL